MAKTKVLNVGKVTKALEAKFSSWTKDEAEMDSVATIMRSELVANLRDGYGSDDTPLPSLKSSTIKKRAELERAGNKTHSSYFDSFSNATFSGKLVQALKVTAIRTAYLGRRQFWFQYLGTHQGYKQRNGTVSKSVANSEIAQGLSSRGWKLTGVTKKAENRIRTRFIRFIRRKK